MVMLRIKPYVPPEHPEEPPKAPVEPIDIPVVSGPAESQTKKLLCKFIDWAIEQLLKAKARLRQQQEMVLPEIKEEDAP
jgi:hypothetical protein